MMSQWIRLDQLRPEDLAASQIWEYVEEGPSIPDTAVRPVSAELVSDLTGRFIATELRLHNGTTRWGLVSNISPNDARKTRHFLCVTVEKDGRWFHLARYHDADVQERGPQALAGFLRLSVEEVFPIEYDVSCLVIGQAECVRGAIEAEPDEKLTADELVDLALDDDT